MSTPNGPNLSLRFFFKSHLDLGWECRLVIEDSPRLYKVLNYLDLVNHSLILPKDFIPWHYFIWIVKENGKWTGSFPELCAISSSAPLLQQFSNFSEGKLLRYASEQETRGRWQFLWLLCCFVSELLLLPCLEARQISTHSTQDPMFIGIAALLISNLGSTFFLDCCQGPQHYRQIRREARGSPLSPLMLWASRCATALVEYQQRTE